MFPDGNRRGIDPGGKDRQSGDWQWQAWACLRQVERSVPRVDADHGRTDLRLPGALRGDGPGPHVFSRGPSTGRLD